MKVVHSRRCLLPEGIRPAAVTVAGGRIVEIGDAPAGPHLDLGDLLLAPGLVDIHGDAFERQVMPRPGVMVDVALGLEETDRQLAANGITTAFHGVTWSWEPGLRSVETGHRIVDEVARLRPRLAVDHRIQLRFEAYNLDGLEAAARLIDEGHVHLLAFNDHTPAIVEKTKTATSTVGYAIRAGMSIEAFSALAREMTTRADEVPAGTRSLAAKAMAAGIPMLSHDDSSPAHRRSFHALGCRICEFPTNVETAAEAVALGDWVVMGCPNVLRGKSHIGWASATDLVKRRLCSILASDYFYPAMLHAVFRLARDGIATLEEAWALVSRNPAQAAGLEDRGVIAVGARADLIAVDDRDVSLPRVAATMSSGRFAYRSPPI
jgi:alpha-D-ribose 1-methylphosphonate 5-triphosphate diphosphatase